MLIPSRSNSLMANQTLSSYSQVEFPSPLSAPNNMSGIPPAQLATPIPMARVPTRRSMQNPIQNSVCREPRSRYSAEKFANETSFPAPRAIPKVFARQFLNFADLFYPAYPASYASRDIRDSSPGRRPQRRV